MRCGFHFWRFSFLLTFVLFVGSGWGTDYFASPEGDDGNDGLGATAERAWKSVQRAVVRLQPGDRLFLRGGVYREKVRFPRSGRAEAPIVLLPYQQEKPMFTGCDPVEGWELYDAEKGIWRAPMNWTLGKGRNQVFAAGELRIEARHPNAPDKNLEMYVADLSPLWPTFGKFTLEHPKENAGRFVSKHLEGDPEDHWKGACYYGVHYQGWAAQTGIVESSKSGEITVGDRTKTWWFGTSYKVGHGDDLGRGMLVGHINALDQPGEWCWRDKFLYLMTEGGKRPVAVEAKRRQLIFDLSEREHIQLRGLTGKSGSLRLENSAHCLVDHCDFSYISHYRRHYNIGQIEKGRDTIKSGETGIFVGGHDNRFTNCRVRFSAGAGFYLRGYHHTIHNCLIDEVSYTSHYLNAITDAVSDFPDYENFLVGGHVITFNTMRNAGRHFFNFYGNGTSTASRDRRPMDYMATLFAHNHLYNGMLQTLDAGFLTGYFCSGGTLNRLNSQVVYNVMHDSYDLAGMRWGVLGIVYLDAGTCNVDLHHNLLWAAPGSHQRGLWFNTACVGISEHHNRFHPEFERGSDRLKAEDFPEERPFRFGHDLGQPPALPKWPQLERLSRKAGDIRSTAGEGSLGDASWLDFGIVDFDRGWQSAVLRFASPEKALNSNKASRARPRHQKVTDPLVMEAIVNDGTSPGIRRQWTFLHNIADDGWLRFNQVPLGEGYRRFRVIYGNDKKAPRHLTVHLDSIEGPQIASVPLLPTDPRDLKRIQIYAEATAEVSLQARGTHDVFVVLHCDDGEAVANVEYFRFEQYRGAIPLQSNEVKFELRLQAPDGEKIGEFYPRFTGGNDSFRNLVCSLEPVHGKQHLFLSVRSANNEFKGTVGELSLEKASHPIDWTGVGIAPRREDGKAVYPKPTNRPRSRPNDIYGKQATLARKRPLGICRARFSQTPPVIDGKLDDWDTGDEFYPIAMAESYNGIPSAGPQSRAWIRYDEQALYVALDNPVKNGASLLPSQHQWGSNDGVEVAWQNAFAEKAGSIFSLYGFPDGHFVCENYNAAPPAMVARLQKEVTYAASVTATGWRCEWRIPFSAWDYSLSQPPFLLFNLGVRKTDPLSWVIWRGTGGASHAVDRAGMLLLDGFDWQGSLPPVSNPALWFDAADPATIESDEQGMASSWRDKSGKQRHAIQPKAEFRPQFSEDALNDLPALCFDEKRRTHFVLPDLSGEKISGTVFVVFTNPKLGAPENHDARLFTASDGKGYDYQIGIAATIPGRQIGGPRQSLHEFKDAWAKCVRIGCFSPNLQTFFTGSIAEILVYDRALSEREKQRIRAWLAGRWRLQ